MKSYKVILSFFVFCVMLLLSEPSLNAQTTKSHIITEYGGKKYYIHTVQKKQSLEEIAKMYAVSMYEIMSENKDAKTNLKAGTLLRIPFKEVKIDVTEEIVADNDIDVDVYTDTMDYEHEYVEYVEPKFDSERLYNVALMMPLYLEQVDARFLNSEVSNKQLLTKPFSYLHFYEGFMIAVDSMVNSKGMKLNLKVYDVDQDTTKAIAALEDPWLETVDVIIGPFHVKTFEKVMDFATENDILIVNPMTNREDMTVGNRNLVKVKPSYSSQMRWIEYLIKSQYKDNNVFIFAMDSSNMEYARMIESVVLENVNPYSLVSNQHIKKVIKKHQDALKREEVEFDASKYKSDNITIDISLINQNPEDSTMLKNQVVVFDYSKDSLKAVKKVASLIRSNLFIVYGDNRVFATEMLNKVNILSGNYPSKLIALPDWSKFDKLFNENLMKLNTVIFDDEYTDYDAYSVSNFICKFRDKYVTEPKDVAYHGFNIGWYFLNALMNYGDDIEIGITSYSIPLLNTKYDFERRSSDDGAENTYWNLYQYIDYDKKLLQYE